MTGLTIDRVLVVVPAHNEVELLGRQLNALRGASAQVARLEPQVAVSITVVLDSCTDGTHLTAIAYDDVQTITVDHTSVGLARRSGVAHARAQVDCAPERTWVACTDADSAVPVDWLTGQLADASEGAELVLGTVWPDPQDVDEILLGRWRCRQDLVEGHPHVHGANLGFTLAAYDRAGGYTGRRTDEDVDLVTRMKDAGVPWTASARIPVLTSGRRGGRVPSGFASYLQALMR